MILSHISFSKPIDRFLKVNNNIEHYIKNESVKIWYLCMGDQRVTPWGDIEMLF